MYGTPQKKAPEAPKRTICECLWCGSRFGGDANGNCANYCATCRTADQRKALKEENEKITKEYEIPRDDTTKRDA